MCRSATLLLAALPLVPLQDGPRDPSPTELQPLAAALAGWREAVELQRAVEPAETAVLSALVELGATLGGDPLARPRVLGRAVLAAGAAERDDAKPERVTTASAPGGSFGRAGLAYAFRLPAGYEPDGAPWPLVLSLPDEGEAPQDHLRASWHDGDLLDHVILVSPAMPASREDWTRVMVAGRPGGLSHALTALRVASERFAVDDDRVVVVGHGKSVPAAVAVADHAPQCFAGLVGRTGDTDELGPDNLAGVPSFFAGGGARARAFVDAARAVGADSKLVETATEQDVWGWMRGRVRATHPDQTAVRVGDPFPTRVDWLRVAPIESDARAAAFVDRATNRIRIESHGVSHATLYLNDELLDLGRPITVVADGVESQVTAARSVRTLLDLLRDGTSPTTSPYVAELVVDLRRGERATGGTDLRLDAALRERIGAVEGDADALLALRHAFAAEGNAAAAEVALRRALRLHPDSDAAHEAAGHARAGDRWFADAAAVEGWQASQREPEAQARGYEKWLSEWMHPDDKKHAAKGAVRDPLTGLWATPEDRKRLEQGWARQDLAWIAPDEAWHVDEGQWKVGGEWCDLALADRRHASLDAMWVIPTPDVLLYATTDRDVALRAAREMARAMQDLRKVFGAEPQLPLPVALLRDEEQVDRLAFGDPDGRRAPAHAGRMHVVHRAFYSESWMPLVDGERVFRGMGVGLWDATIPYGDQYGVHAARLAVGLSYGEALDPSPKAVRKALARSAREAADPGYWQAYREEKVLPDWFRLGGAVYAERFFLDDTVVVKPGVVPPPDPWWARTWSLDNLRAKGGLRPLADVLAFPLDPDAPEDGEKLLLEAGLVTAFVVDGGCAPVQEAHAAVKRALADGRARPALLRKLEAALLEHEAELRQFAGIE